MDDTVLGILAVVVGLVLSFRGYVALRVVITVWGAAVGFAVGANLMASFTGRPVLSTVLAWVVGFVIALVFAVLAYAYYAVAVVLAMGSFGFVLGTASMAALNVTWNWLIIVVAVALGVLLAIVAIAANLPLMLLIVASALAGASAVVGGIMLLVGELDTTDLASTSVTEQISHQWYWYAAYIAMVIVGIVQQSRASTSHTVRDAWQQAPVGRVPA